MEILAHCGPGKIFRLSPRLPPRDNHRWYLLVSTGSVRKSMSLLDHPRGGPAHSLRYFTSLVEEVRTFPDSSWPHQEFSLRRCERIRQAIEPGTARPGLALSEPFGAVRKPAPAAAGARKQTG